MKNQRNHVRYCAYRRFLLLYLPVLALALGGCGASAVTAVLQTPSSITQHGITPSDPGDIRVMSFNVRTRFIMDGGNHWNHRKTFLCEVIRSFNPDILSTQEPDSAQIDYLSKSFPDYSFVGVGRNDGRRSGEMCGVFFKRSRFTRLDEGHFWLSESPDTPGSRSWGAVFPRVVTWVKLRANVTGNEFYLFNTHFDAWSSPVREKSSMLLRERIARISRGTPVILTGDFNTDEGTTPYQVLTAPRNKSWDVTLLDTLRAINPFARHDEGTRHSFNGDTNSGRIDWILVSPAFKTVSAMIDRSHRGSRYPSDHFPVTAILRWRPNHEAAQRYTLGG